MAGLKALASAASSFATWVFHPAFTRHLEHKIADLEAYIEEEERQMMGWCPHVEPKLDLHALAEEIRSHTPRPRGDMTINNHVTHASIHGLADALDRLADKQ